MRTIVIASALSLVLVACSNESETTTTVAEPAPAVSDMAEETLAAGPSLEDAINHERREGNRARDEWRHPQETLSFFGIEPDMTIAEVLPGNGGWYSQILTPLTAERGRMIGLTYPDSLFSQMFGTWDAAAVERIGADISQMGRYLSVAGVESSQPTVGYTIDNIPSSMDGEADAVLFFRAMHHLFRFEEPIIDTAMAEVYDLLAPGGVAGVVQHRAPEDADPDFANGNNGYLKQSDVVAAFERAGFVLEASSEINANPNDAADNMVWRLPPTTTDNPATQAIGESDRMTLRFRKPE
ncbi:MAG: methyltransferase [Pseudomonadales bacterium]|nr:methyltransferase [Pseudomonadales bacterium]